MTRCRLDCPGHAKLPKLKFERLSAATQSGKRPSIVRDRHFEPVEKLFDSRIGRVLMEHRERTFLFSSKVFDKFHSNSSNSRDIFDPYESSDWINPSLYTYFKWAQGYDPAVHEYIPIPVQFRPPNNRFDFHEDKEARREASIAARGHYSMSYEGSGVKWK